MTLTMVHSNPATLDNDSFTVDRKFHIGMLNYARELSFPLTTIHPRRHPDQPIMDPVTIPLSQLPYKVLLIQTDRVGRPLATDIRRLREAIAGSRLLYGTGFGTSLIARELQVPYIPVLEYDLKTQITDSTSQVTSKIRRAIRIARCTWRYAFHGVSEMRNAHSIHCNGYPIFDVATHYNTNCLLYLDSRMSEDMVIPRDELRTRLAARGNRPLRLLYSGRYEQLKGSDDAVRVAVECLRRNLNIEMHCYGQGTLIRRMKEIAGASSRPEQIVIHEAIPFTELVKVSRSCDLFVCCHIQNDPSCTYLESLGAGLPIVGYGNRMWQRLCEASQCGLTSTMGRPRDLVDRIESLLANPALLNDMSERARTFAIEHSFEREFKKRTDSLRETMKCYTLS